MPKSVAGGAVPPKVLQTEADLAAAVAALCQRCPVLRRLHDDLGLPPLRRSEAGLPGLARIVIGQQVSTASAAAIWTRFSSVAGDLTAARFAAMTDEEYRAGGLSRPKVRTMRAIAAALDGGLDLDALATAEPAAARAALMGISGIGPWTADIYLMFCLGLADAFPAGDLALQIAAQDAFARDSRPSADALAKIAEARWKPWRAAAAALLWHAYAHARARGSASPV